MSTVFWSWQSDLDPWVTRNVIRDALADAIDELQADLEERVELTSDTKGVAGSPDIVATILEKIDACAVFVADVTPIAISHTGKAVANPNVLIELGYAKKSLGLNRIVLLWNTAFEGTTPERLPFDMRTRRAPIGFQLAPRASKAELATVRESLRGVLKDALSASLAVPGSRAITPTVDWEPSSPECSALWFDPKKPLPINEDGAPGTKAMRPGPYAYVRVLPSKWTRPADFGAGNHSHILGDTRGFSWGTTRGWFLTYSGSLRASEQSDLANMTMQFRQTGELWGVESRIADTNDGWFFADYVIKSFNDFVEANLSYLLGQQARGPFRVRLGVTDLDGLQWVSETHWGGKPQALESIAETNFSLSGTGEEERLTALEHAWGEIAAAFGVMQPSRATLVKQIRGF
ncbi:MAG TPA: hypothetical protein VKC17_08825 [Sphingomicrobium sp.]|nr:hypothetical protein [Sphingomicrobium sp.]